MVEKVEYGGWLNCLRLAGAQVELVVTTDVGPRIVHFGFVGGRNELRVFPEQLGQRGGREWRIYGGHRLWHAPEAKPRSYQPDNDPVEAEVEGETIRLVQPVEEGTGIQKTLRISLAGPAQVRIDHILTNRSMWPVTLAPWALTVMAPGGVALLPQPPLLPPGDDTLLPNRSIVLWPYTRTSDPRLGFGERFLRLAMDPALAHPAKLGTQASEGWCAYVNAGHCFLKRVPRQKEPGYPDFGCGLESYTAGDFLELETLGALATLQPGESAAHTERWFLFDGADASDEASVERTVLPRVRETEGH